MPPFASVTGSEQARRTDAAAARPGWYALALVLFVAALLAKTVTCTLPAVILLLALWWNAAA